ncbi:XrtA/PEP-CTERM system TPR-repeat protein PrsT [Alteromonas sp. 009811495]|uniref:XrtA/PEP-CTERM system TPR-repeat protein PrsT n=1 Tax=Alteromonas sp. 009811495 TaxID=3002962 RepID=UPI00237D376D|nr:XrtA/PEP-CTERM system TPR-repeat protein PrsT [Alteromonas sp. 009811495]WDT84848.1 PEP-CTERM system TPR-repeat protein PrsT [Alteromonas sp. 009811495]
MDISYKKRRFAKNALFSIITTTLLALQSPISFATTSEDYEKALTSFNNNAYDEAYIHLKNSLQKDPENLAAKLLMGEILLINGYLTAAEMEFVEALEMGADINLLAEPLGNTWLFLNKYQDIVEFSNLDRLSGEAEREWLLIRATACIRLEDEACALRDYNTIIAASPDFVPAINGLASIALQNEDLDKAAGLITKAINIEPENAITWRLKGQLAYRQGDTASATSHLQKALSFNRDDPIALRNLVDLYLEAKDYDTAKLFVDEIIEDTPNDPLAILLNSWLQSRDSDQAIDNTKLKELNDFMAQLDPELITSQPMLLYISGLTNFFNNNMETAAKDFNAYLQKEPEDLQAVLMLSQVYIATQQDKQALLLLERHQSALMEDVDSALLLGDLFIRQNKAFKAERLLEDLETLFPEEGKLQLFKIKLMAARGKQAQALEILEKNLANYTENAGFLFTYSLMNLQAEQFDNALKGANLLNSMFPDKAEVYNLKAGILIRQGNLSQAKVNIEKALEKNPTLFPAKFNLAATESRLGNTVKSNELVEELLQLSPQHNETLLLKAFNLTRSGDVEKAKQIYLDVLTLNPSNIGARERISSLYQRLGDTKSALYHLDLLLKDDFDNADYLLRKAQLLIDANRTSDAEKTLGIVRNFIDDTPEKLIVYSDLMRSLGKNEAAKSAMETAHSVAKQNTFVTFRYVSLLLDLQDNEKAGALLASIPAAQQQNAVYQFLKGRLEANKGDTEDAITYYRNALELDPRFSQAFIAIYNYALNEEFVDVFLEIARELSQQDEGNLLARNLLAQYLFFIREFDESIALYKALVEEPNLLNPAEAFNRLAIMSIDSSLQEARKFAEKAYSLQPNSARVLDTFGYIKALEGDLEGSLRMLRDAFARDANDPNIRYHLGFTLAKLNRIEEAKKELEYAVNVERPFFLRPKAQALLESL